MIAALARSDGRFPWILPAAGLVGAVSLLVALTWPRLPGEPVLDVPQPHVAHGNRGVGPAEPLPLISRPAGAESRPLSLARLLRGVPPARLAVARAEIERGLALRDAEQSAEALALALEHAPGPLAAGLLLASGDLLWRSSERLHARCRRLPPAGRLQVVEAFFAAVAASESRMPPARRADQVRSLLDGIEGDGSGALLVRIAATPGALDLLGGIYRLMTHVPVPGAELKLDRLLDSGQVPPEDLIRHLEARWIVDASGALPLLMRACDHPSPIVRATARGMIVKGGPDQTYKPGWLALFPSSTGDERVTLACKLADAGHRPAWRQIKTWLDAGDWARARRCIAFLARYSGGEYSDPLDLPSDLRWAVARHWSQWVERHLSTPASGRPRPPPRRW